MDDHRQPQRDDDPRRCTAQQAHNGEELEKVIDELSPNAFDAVIVDAKYDDAMEQNEYGYCAVKNDKGWGALKADGTVVVNPSINLDEYLVIDFINTYHRVNDLNLYVYTK